MAKWRMREPVSTMNDFVEHSPEARDVLSSFVIHFPNRKSKVFFAFMSPISEVGVGTNSNQRRLVPVMIAYKTSTKTRKTAFLALTLPTSVLMYLSSPIIHH